MENWTVLGGNYKNRTLIHTNPGTEDSRRYHSTIKTYPSEESIHRPGFMEKFFIERISYLLENESKRPILFVDFGGQYGVSTLRLAKRFSKEIEDGSVAFVVTNIFDDKKRIETILRKETDKEIQELMATSFPLVHYIQADAQELKDQNLNINGELIPIKDNVSIIHESYSIGHHGNMNDIDYPLLASLLNKDGILLADRSCTKPVDSLANQRLKEDIDKSFEHKLPAAAGQRLSEKWGLNSPIKNTYNFLRSDQAAKAYRNLHIMGLKVLDQIMPPNNTELLDLNYAIWTKPTSSLFQIQLLDGSYIEVKQEWFK